MKTTELGSVPCSVVGTGVTTVRIEEYPPPTHVQGPVSVQLRSGPLVSLLKPGYEATLHTAREARALAALLKLAADECEKRGRFA